MNKSKLFSFIFAFIFAFTSNIVSAKDNFFYWIITYKRFKEVAVVDDVQYKDECGSCHFAYPPGLLPERSWKKLLSSESLADHFGDNAELDEPLRQHIQEYAVSHSADKSYYKRARKVMASLRDDQSPMRIIDTRYIKEKHEDIPANQIKGNDKVKSLSYCDKCHRKAEKGIFDDDTVLIPGYEDQ